MEFTDAGKATDTSPVILAGESDSQSHLKASITVKKKRKSKTLKTHSQHVAEEAAHEFKLVLEESYEHQTDGCEAVMKPKHFKAMSRIGHTQTSTDIKTLGQDCADYKLEMASLVEIPEEAGQAECGISLFKEKTKKKNMKKKMNVGEEKTDAETNVQIVEKPPKLISLHGQLETTETEVHKAKSQGGDPGQLEASSVDTKNKRKSKKLFSSLQEVGEESVQSLPEEFNAGDEIRKLLLPQEVDEDSATHSQQGTSATQRKKMKKKLKSCLQDVGVEVKPPAMLENTDNALSRLPCPTSEEDSVTQCRRLKAGTTNKKKRKGKKFLSSSQEVDITSQKSWQEVTATDIAPAVEVTGAEAQSSEALMVSTKKTKKKSKEETGSKVQVLDLDVKEHELSSDSAYITNVKDYAAESSPPKSVKKAKKKELVSSNEEEPMLEDEKQPAVEAFTKRMHTQWKKNKIQKKQGCRPAEEAKEECFLKKTVKKKAVTDVPDTVSLTPMKKGKKKRKLQPDYTETSQSNGHADEEMGRKKVKSSVSLYFVVWYYTPS